MRASKSQYIALAITAAATVAYFYMRRKNKTQVPSLLNNPNLDMSTNQNLPRGYRNNNPLNIRYSTLNSWKGKVIPNTDRNNAFEQFISMPYGYRAALYLLRKYIKSYGCNTIGKIIQKWAPPTENNTQGYITSVCNLIKTNFGRSVGADTAISANSSQLLCEMAYAMSIVENGITAETKAAGLPNMEAIQDGWNLL